MNVYEVINPSDETTCEAESLAVAAFSTLLVCSQYGVMNAAEESDRFFDCFQGIAAFAATWGEPKEFGERNAEAIIACLESFAYLSPRERRRYKPALELIDDPEKRRLFRDEHEDSARTSTTQICKRAWRLAENIRANMRRRTAIS